MRGRRQRQQVGRERLIELVVADVDQHQFRLERQQLEAADGLFFVVLEAERGRRLVRLEGGGDALQQGQLQLVGFLRLAGRGFLSWSSSLLMRLVTISRSANISSSRKRRS